MERLKPQGRPRFGPDSLLVTLILAIALFNQIWGEKVEVNGGLFYDGVIYASWARDLSGTVFKQGLDPYFVQRFLPSAVVHVSLYLCGAEMTNANIITSFIIMNIIAELTALWIWSRIAIELNLGVYGRCLSLAGIFMNFFFLKNRPYCPVMTDDVAFFIGLLQFLFFLRGKTAGLLLTTAVGAFVWPTAFAVGMVLAVFSRTSEVEPSATRFSLQASVTLAAAVSVGFLLVFVAQLSRGHLIVHFEGAQPLLKVLPLSVVLAVGTILAGLIPLLNDRRLYSLPLLLGSLNLRNTMLAGGVALAIKVLQWCLTNPGAESFGLKHRVAFTVITAVAKPGISLLALLVFWGPVLWLIVFYWKTVCRAIHRMGIGLTLAATGGFLVAICTEPRGSLNIIPMVILVGVKAIEHQVPARLLCWILVPVSLFASRFWFQINVPGRPFVQPFTTSSHPLVDFPAQRYFMSLGPWMSTPSYLLQLSLALALAVVLYVVCFRITRQPGASVATGARLT